MPYTQGTLKSMNFSTDSGTFSANWIYSASARGPSVAYLSKDYWYTEGPTVLINVDGYQVKHSTVNAKYENNYWSFDLSLDPNIKDGDYITFVAY